MERVIRYEFPAGSWRSTGLIELFDTDSVDPGVRFLWSFLYTSINEVRISKDGGRKSLPISLTKRSNFVRRTRKAQSRLPRNVVIVETTLDREHTWCFGVAPLHSILSSTRDIRF